MGHGFRVEAYDEVASTNDLVRERAERGEPEGLVVVAGQQTAGRGRHGRAWASPVGNLYASILLRPAAPLAEAASLSLIAALAVVEALDPLVGDPERLLVKWPNDVLLGGRKVAGILLEGAEGRGEGSWIVVGLGVNVTWSPPDLGGAATSLAAAGLEARADSVADLLLPRLSRRYADWRRGGFAAVRDAWLNRALGVGSMATLRLGGEQVRGRLADLGEDGSILLENDMGCLTRYTAGELFFG